MKNELMQGELKTKNLILIPLYFDRLKLYMEDVDAFERKYDLAPSNVVLSEDFKQALDQMYHLCKEYPSYWKWFTDWIIIHKKTNQIIGNLGFKGPHNKDLEVEVGFGMNEGFRRQGYMSEALHAVCEAAFLKEDVYYVTAETSPENEACKSFLLKQGFVYDGEGEEGPRYILAQKSTKVCVTVIFFLLGGLIGLAIGAAVEQPVILLCVGAVLGLLFGLYCSKCEKKRLIESRQKRNEKR